MKESTTTLIHKPAQALVFRGKASILQLKRSIENGLDRRVKRYTFSDKLKDASIVAQSKTPLWTESEPQERFLLAGKVHNLRLAIKKLNGLEISGDEIFSFWKHVGQANRAKGYVVGRELREGCIIPNIGGGLCQISNALYDAALQAGFEIVERHAHSQVVAGSLAEQGRDATVFWNYIDLRFRSSKAFRIEAHLSKDYLTVKFRSDVKKQNLVQIAGFKNRLIKKSGSSAAGAGTHHSPNSPNSCATCGVESCFRSLKPEENLGFGRTAFLVDDYSPEFNEYIQKIKGEKDILFIPLDGKRFKKANYAWQSENFAEIKQSLFVTAIRSYKSRRLASQGASRQLNLLAMYEKLAKSYAKNLSHDILHVVVQQNLLPFLWREGVLGGRTFDVLMTALPMKNLQEELDFARSLHPASKTLGDFRADDRLIRDETEALQNAEKIITPHTEIAAMFPEKSEILDWHMPESKELAKKQNEKFTIVFPASTVGRKGCYELREAVRGLDVKVITLGANIEDGNFWQGFNVEHKNADAIRTADLVVLPAFVEHKPHRLLQAAASGIPVIASEFCGVRNVDRIETIESGDADSLRIKITAHLAKAVNAEKIVV